MKYIAQVKTPKGRWNTIAEGTGKRTVTMGNQYERMMLEAGFRYSELHAHRDDLVAGHVLTAEDGTQFRVLEAQDDAPADRTDHSREVANLRDISSELDRLYHKTWREQYKTDAITCRAAADLLEIHDATGMNLHTAPNLLSFVMRTYKEMAGTVLQVENNNA